MRTEDKPMVRNLRCHANNHPYRAEIWQRLHYAPDGVEILFRTTPRYAYDYVRPCSVPGCGSPPKDPNPPNA